MSRILILIIIVIWMSRGIGSVPIAAGSASSMFLFFGGYLLLILLMRLWSSVLARHLRGDNLHRSLGRFHRAMKLARLAIPIWFAAGIFGLGIGGWVSKLLGPINRSPIELPGLLLGILPPLLAWGALWWAQFPADRGLREQGMLSMLLEDLPLHAPPNFWSYAVSNLRMQILFTLVPIVMIVGLHDIVAGAFFYGRGIDLNSPESINIELIIQLASIAIVMLFAPEILRRVLHTQRLPDSPLRDRLEKLCARTGLRYREILLWRTNNNMGNAAVMGLIPQMRFVLLSDVLIETMPDHQIEAVFAHEIGHVKHWHLGWFAVLAAIAVLLAFGPGQFLSDGVDRLTRPRWLSQDLIDGAQAVLSLAIFFWAFGFVSRFFERQADAFAARTIQSHHQLPDVGATVVAAALHRVAIVNNIPIAARDFTHGSIAQRMHHVRELSADPNRAAQFDRAMSILRAGMIAALVTCSAWVLWGMV